MSAVATHTDWSDEETELDRARAHLMECQRWLADVRSFDWKDDFAESHVLAALSWVWEEQEKAALGSTCLGNFSGLHVRVLHRESLV